MFSVNWCWQAIYFQRYIHKIKEENNIYIYGQYLGFMAAVTFILVNSKAISYYL